MCTELIYLKMLVDRLQLKKSTLSLYKTKRNKKAIGTHWSFLKSFGIKSYLNALFQKKVSAEEEH
jgi:hypothetical protein